MKNIFTTWVTFLPSVTCKDGELKKERLGSVLLSERWQPLVEKVRAEADPARRKELKQHLPAFMPSGVFTKKTADGLQVHSGFICIDIDAKDNAGVKDFDRLKEYVCQIPQVAYCGLSVGGVGFFCIIPIADPAKHRDYFRAIERDFKECGITIDRQCYNVNRLRYVSYDPVPYINTAATTYDYVYPMKDHVAGHVPGTVADVETKEKFEAVLRMIEADKIDITGGYRQWFEILCAIASTFGEDGREYAHAVSKWYDNYSPDETNYEYNEVLKHNYSYSIGTFFNYANIEMRKPEHDFDGINFDDLDL